MMKAVLMAAMLLMGTAVYADEPTFFDKAKALVDSVEPRGGVFFNLKNHTIQGYTGAQILTKDIQGFEVDGTIGYAVDKTVIAGLETDVLESFSKVPGVSIKVPWLKVHAGFNVGYSIEDNLIAYGPTVNGSVKW